MSVLGRAPQPSLASLGSCLLSSIPDLDWVILGVRRSCPSQTLAGRQGVGGVGRNYRSPELPGQRPQVHNLGFLRAGREAGLTAC